MNDFVDFALIRKAYDELMIEETIDNIPTASQLMKKLVSIPIVDVTSVIHAHWVIKFKWEPLAWDTDPLDWDRYDEKTHSEEVDYYACSNCGYDGGDWKPNYKYCPNCGAKMDEATE